MEAKQSGVAFLKIIRSKQISFFPTAENWLGTNQPIFDGSQPAIEQLKVSVLFTNCFVILGFWSKILSDFYHRWNSYCVSLLLCSYLPTKSPALWNLYIRLVQILLIANLNGGFLNPKRIVVPSPPPQLYCHRVVYCRNNKEIQSYKKEKKRAKPQFLISKAASHDFSWH